MNYIISTLDTKINLLQGLNRIDQCKPYYQAKLECYLIQLLAYLWNKNIEYLPVDRKEYAINSIMKPSIGSIVATCRELDINKEVFFNKKAKKLSQVINDYPRLRNERIGHGYSFEDSTIELIEMFEKLFSTITDFPDSYLSVPHDLILVLQSNNSAYTGIRYSSDGDVGVWNCPIEVKEFKVNNLYSFSNKFSYNRLTPFLYTDEEEFYLFSSVIEKLTGQVKYNKLFRTGTLQKEYDELASFTTMSDPLKKRTANGTIITQFDRNFKKYIG